MFRLKCLDHVVLRVAAVEPCLRFYEAVLGCTLEQARTELGPYHLRAGDFLIDMVDTAGPIGSAGGPPPGAAELQWRGGGGQAARSGGSVSAGRWPGAGKPMPR